jgi:hypothetical protein
MTKGILFFATNNDNVNYLKIAILNAKLCKKNLGDIPISVVTSTYSLNSVDKNTDLTRLFDKIIIDDKETGEDNIRNYADTQYYRVADKFINGNRNSAYQLSPYDETLLLDVDFLMFDGSMNSIWGCEEDFLINDQALGLDHQPLRGEEFRLNQTGIKMVWATAVYFKKSERAKMVFDLVSLIKERWDYFKLVYGFGGYLYRNDFSFSIALHILNGFLENDEFKKLPTPFILTSTDRDHIHKIHLNGVTMMYNDISMKNHNHDHEFYLTRIKGHNIHIMNKLSLQKFADELIGLLDE